MFMVLPSLPLNYSTITLRMGNKEPTITPYVALERYPKRCTGYAKDLSRTYLFNIFIADMFLVIDNIDLENYADDNRICCNSNCIDDDNTVSLKESIKKDFQWFSINQVKENTNKCHLILSNKGDAKIFG